MRLHFSIAGFDYRTVGLHDFVKVSISASLKSFLLIICIDAPESTTISRSSGLRFDAGRHLFSEGEKNVALSCSFHFNTLLASFHGTVLLPLCLFLIPILNFLERWGYADDVHLGKCVRAKDFCLEFWCDVQWPLCEFHTLDWLRHVHALPENRLRRLHVLKYAQPNCRALDD